jgi:hypothetical protein
VVTPSGIAVVVIKSEGRGAFMGLGVVVAEWSMNRVSMVLNRRHIANERRLGSPWHGHLIALVEVTLGDFA